MTELDLVKALLGVIGALLSVLVVILGWLGSRIHDRLDAISGSLAAIEKDLRNDLTDLDQRVTVIETLNGVKRRR